MLSSGMVAHGYKKTYTSLAHCMILFQITIPSCGLLILISSASLSAALTPIYCGISPNRSFDNSADISGWPWKVRMVLVALTKD